MSDIVLRLCQMFLVCVQGAIITCLILPCSGAVQAAGPRLPGPLENWVVSTSSLGQLSSSLFIL